MEEERTENRKEKKTGSRRRREEEGKEGGRARERTRGREEERARGKEKEREKEKERGQRGWYRSLVVEADVEGLALARKSTIPPANCSERSAVQERLDFLDVLSRKVSFLSHLLLAFPAR
eukprot:3940413-Rhodomonas_salina.3